MRKLDDHEYRGLVAIVLAVGFFVVVLAAIIALTLRNKALTESGSEVMIAILGAIVGVLAGYVGGRVQTIVEPTQEKKMTTLFPKDLQTKLMEQGYDLPKYGADGMWGTETANACEAWFDDEVIDLNSEPPEPTPAPDNPIPQDWLPACDMTYITVHWTAGAYECSDVDKEHYHLIVDGDGIIRRGDYPISANVSTSDNDGYAAHTSSANTKNIGISACCMAGAVESPFDAGKYPLTKLQWETLAKMAAQLAREYDIPVDKNHILQHGTWQQDNGVAQSGKWDICKLPWDSTLTKNQVRDQFLAMVKDNM